tara:strand:- start:5 stop:460 length:456 start_codon:yes stop_codon:yes gene_type:complete
MVKLIEKEINDIKIYFFSIYDKKNRGSIQTDNEENVFLFDALLNSFYYLGIKIKENEINFLIKENNFDKNGIIYFEDFIKIIENRLENITSKDEIEEYFNLLSDNKDYILQSDLHKILEGKNAYEMIDEMITDIDCKNGKIYYHDFCKIFN